MGFAPTWHRQVTPPLLHKTTLTTVGLRPQKSVLVLVLHAVVLVLVLDLQV